MKEGFIMLVCGGFACLASFAVGMRHGAWGMGHGHVARGMGMGI